MFTTRYMGALLMVLVMGWVVHAAESGPWGEAADGLQVGLRVDVGERATLHPGEYASYQVEVRSVGVPGLSLPAGPHDRYVHLHVRLPDGKEIAYLPSGPSVSKPEWFICNQWVPWAPGRPWPIRIEQGRWRLSERRAWNWVDFATGQGLVAPLQTLGVYRAWAEFEVRLGKDAPGDAWHGVVKSNVVEWRVDELPPDQRKLQMTAQQAEDIRLWLESDGAPGPTWDRLGAALERTENEGLALHLAGIVANDPKHAARALGLLSFRTGYLRDLGIDGPYLRQLAEMSLSRLEASDGARRIGAVFIITYLHYHYDDAPIRDRAVKLALHDCRIPGPKARPTAAASGPSTRMMVPQVGPLGGAISLPGGLHFGLSDAWEILLQARVLREGMSIEEAIGILGEPTSRGEGSLIWYANSPMHVNPILTASTKGGRITGWGHGRA